ncbi:MAG: type IV pilin [Haloferacaceae archaeon]
MAARGTTPVVGVVVLLAVGLALGGVVAAGAEAVATATGQELGSGEPDAGASVAVSLRVEGDTIALTHEAGPELRISAVRLVVAVDGTPLAHQPPVPFFAAEGFRGGPTGPFNVENDGLWEPDETGSLRVAGTNDPQPAPGRTVSVRIYVDDERVATVRGTVG